MYLNNIMALVLLFVCYVRYVYELLFILAFISGICFSQPNI